MKPAFEVVPLGPATRAPQPAQDDSKESLRADRGGDDDADMHAANDITLRLYAEARKSSTNVMVSAVSLRSALAPLYLGARGPTATEMARGLGWKGSPEDVTRAARSELAVFQAARKEGSSMELVLSSRVWVDERIALDSKMAKRAESFGAPPEGVDFRSSAEKARGSINAWIAQQTNERIRELLPAGTVGARTKLVVTNAIWFKGRWLEPFSRDATRDEPFFVGKTQSKGVPMMHVTGAFRYADIDGVKAVDLFYEGGDLAMTVVVPSAKDGLPALEAELSEPKLARWTSALATRQVVVSLPRFTFRSGGSMNAALQALGIKTAFGSKADFSGLFAPSSQKERPRLDQVVQQTWIATDEVGTEASAATGGVTRTTSLVLGPVTELKADRPFLFLVRDVRGGRVLFVGRVTDPS